MKLSQVAGKKSRRKVGSFLIRVGATLRRGPRNTDRAGTIENRYILPPTG